MSDTIPPPPVSRDVPPGDVPVGAAPSRPRRYNPVPLIALVLILGAVVGGLAYYQEELGYFMNLKLWDRGAPARTVHDFFEAASKGDEAAASQYLAPVFQPIKTNGRLVGYFTHDPHFGRNTSYLFSKIAPTDLNAKMDTEFVLRGDGGAIVTVPDHSGAAEKMHLSMLKGSWRITEIY